MNFQIVIHRERFPDETAQFIRDQAMSKLDEAYEIIAEAEAGISKHVWLKTVFLMSVLSSS